MRNANRRAAAAAALVLVGEVVGLLGCARRNERAPAPAMAAGTTGAAAAAAPGGASASSGTPVFLRATAWPPALRVPFTSYTPGATSYSPPVRSGPNALDYSFPAANGAQTDGKLHSFFRNCLPFPCVPASFVQSSSGPLPCQFYLFRDASQGGHYMAYVYSEPLHQYAVVASGLGPMFPDFLERYHKVNPVAPQPRPPAGSNLYVGNPEDGSVLWFRAAGFGGYPETEDLFAPYDAPTRTSQGNFRRPYSFGGKHGQAVYGPWDLQPVFGTQTFTPPAGYQEVTAQPVTYPNGITLACPMRVPFDLYDHPASPQEPLRETVMVCTACHASDAREKSAP